MGGDCTGLDDVWVSTLLARFQWRAGAHTANISRRAILKATFVFSASRHTARHKLGKMVLPQMEEDCHGVEVVVALRGC